MRHNIVLQGALFREGCLSDIKVAFMEKGTLELVILPLRVRGNERLWGVADHAPFTLLSRNVYLCITVAIAECLMQVDLVYGARRARKPAMPHKVEDALGGCALERLSYDHLWEVIGIVLILWVALVLDVRLILAAWV